MFDSVVCANGQLAQRLIQGGIGNAETIRMGVEPHVFTPDLRSRELRLAALEALGLEPEGVLLLAVGRFSAEKRWDLVIRSVGESRRKLPVGLLLVGNGAKRQKLEFIARQYDNVDVLPRITDRRQLATLLASSDALVHGCESETFCLVAAEARASGLPLIVPDRGAAVDHLIEGAGTTYRAGCEISLERAIARFVKRGPELQRAAAVRSSALRTMDEHFAELFARYEVLASGHWSQPVVQTADIGMPQLEPVPAVVLARSGRLL
jgi:alpha-1,6-mannosyltransferase